MDHSLAKMLLIMNVSEIIAQEYHLSLKEARDELYKAGMVDLIENDETGLYGESPQYCFSVYQARKK